MKLEVGMYVKLVNDVEDIVIINRNTNGDDFNVLHEKIGE